jgi:hypothetical protein
MTGAQRRQQWLDDYRKGLHPYAQIHPADRPPAEVQRDPFGAESQAWLAENAPKLTLDACAVTPAPLRTGHTLQIPGDGAEVVADQATERTDQVVERTYQWRYGTDGTGQSYVPVWDDDEEDDWGAV